MLNSHLNVFLPLGASDRRAAGSGKRTRCPDGEQGVSHVPVVCSVALILVLKRRSQCKKQKGASPLDLNVEVFLYSKQHGTYFARVLHSDTMIS